MSYERKWFVRCCEETQYDNIYLDEADAVFRYTGNNEQFQYCPWCGVLLDMNLPMTKALDSDDETR